MRSALLSLVLLTVSAGSLLAQAGMGGISGDVRDASGASVPGAAVTISNPLNGIRRVLQTSSAGLFAAAALLPSDGYSLTVSKAGFSDYIVDGITVKVGETTSVPIALKVSSESTKVEVTAEAAQLDEARTETSSVVTNREINDLPINGRRFDSFVLLTPGVTNDGTFGLVTFRGVAGGNSFLSDGVDTTNQFFNEASGRNRIRSQISQDAVQEFQVISAGYLPEFGRASGGVINTVTKSGTNDMHGSFFWFFRNRTLNARDRYAAFNPPEVQHQTGGAFSGAIKKDKLFYFANTEILRRHFPIASSYSRPGVVESAHFLGCGAPATPAQCAAIDSILPRHYGQVERSANSELFFLKLDWRPDERNSVSANVNYLRFISPNGIQTGASLTNGGALGSNADSTVRDRVGRLSWTRIVTNNLLNEFRFGWVKDRQYDGVSQNAAPPFGNLTLTVNGATNLGISPSYPRLNPSEQRFQYSDNFTWNTGKHALKFGIDVSNTQDVTDSLTNRYGTYTYGTVTAFALDFSGNTTGAKNWQTFSQGFLNSRTDSTTRDWAFYAQDQFRVTSRLTWNYGLRYDFSQIPQPSITNPDYPQTGRINAYQGGIGPRTGLAYSFPKAKTVVRVGYGLFNGRYVTGTINSLFVNNGVFQKSVSYNSAVAADKAAGPVWPLRLASSDRSGGAVDITFAAPDYRPSYTQNGDVTVEKQFGSNTTASIAYLYNRGFHLPTVRDLNIGVFGPTVTYTIQNSSGQAVGTYATPTYRTANRVDSRYRRVNQLETGGKSWYDGMALNVQSRLRKDLTYRLSYTWSHEIDLGQGSGSDNINLFGTSGPSLNNLTNGNYRQDKASGALDQRHRLSLSFLASHDFAKGKNGVPAYLLNGWQLSGILTLASGRPTFATVNIQTLVSGLPFFTLNGFGGDTRVPFLPMNPVDYPSSKRMDARVTKRLAFRDHYRLSLSFEAFNITNSQYDTSMNHTAYNASSLTLTPAVGFTSGTASAGFPDGTNARRAQTSLRFDF